ncbi:hypothetical protein THERMOS_1465 [Bathymodiolus thermophilus thioautotrophic gill symbiont]|uniref:Uncharacterized protein n=2 Tax=Bathymodiolus thermophilus thioautotrophic gill symbiont TaxID=2360 RepID=A0A8H9CH22_9GAMM|nr:hypothetical protein THERMOS_1465 [Bathymodiolus thermophilus thioautotrophic gill symbiont]
MVIFLNLVLAGLRLGLKNYQASETRILDDYLYLCKGLIMSFLYINKQAVMHSIQELETQQVNLNIPTYLLNDIDEITEKYKVDRSEVLIEAAKSYVASIVEQDAHERLYKAFQEVRQMREGKTPKTSARSLLDEL